MGKKKDDDITEVLTSDKKEDTGSTRNQSGSSLPHKITLDNLNKKDSDDDSEKVDWSSDSSDSDNSELTSESEHSEYTSETEKTELTTNIIKSGFNMLHKTPRKDLLYFSLKSLLINRKSNVLYFKKDFKKDYLLKRIDLDNKHIQCMLDPYNKEYIGYCINLNIPYEGGPINDYDEEKSVIADIKDEELLNNIDIISKFNMDGYYKNKFEESMKKNSEDDSYNKFLLKMKLLREKKEKDLMEKQEQYIHERDFFCRRRYKEDNR